MKYANRLVSLGPRFVTSNIYFKERVLCSQLRFVSSLPLTNNEFLKNPKESQTVTINGWIKSVRKSKNVAFADISDGTSGIPISVILTPEDAKPLLTGACVEITGTVQKAPPKNPKTSQQRHQDFEIVASNINLLGPATKDYPLQKKFHTQEFLRSIPEYRWKTNTGAAVLRYRSFAISKISQYFQTEGFTQVNSPLITASDCEGGGEVFQLSGGREGVDFFGKNRPAFLSVSSQLHLEIYSGALSRVWNLSPAFRAEASDTNRHLSEFWIVEAEIAFVHNLDQVMVVVENMIKSAVAPLLEDGNEYARDLLAVKRDNESKNSLLERWNLIAGNESFWPRISYGQAVQILNQEFDNDNSIFGGVPPPQWGDSISSVHEKYLAGSYFKSPVFVTDYPIEQKPFYMLLNEPLEVNGQQQQTVSCFDLLIPHIGELVGGSMRESAHDKLLKSMKDKGMNPDDLGWYLRLRQHGSFPHGGYGMGFERFLAFITGQENVREVIGFPRWAGNCVC